MLTPSATPTRNSRKRTVVALALCLALQVVRRMPRGKSPSPCSRRSSNVIISSLVPRRIKYGIRRSRGCTVMSTLRTRRSWLCCDVDTADKTFVAVLWYEACRKHESCTVGMRNFSRAWITGSSNQKTSSPTHRSQATHLTLVVFYLIVKLSCHE